MLKEFIFSYSHLPFQDNIKTISSAAFWWSFLLLLSLLSCYHLYLFLTWTFFFCSCFQPASTWLPSRGNNATHPDDRGTLLSLRLHVKSYFTCRDWVSQTPNEAKALHLSVCLKELNITYWLEEHSGGTKHHGGCSAAHNVCVSYFKGLFL